MTAITVSPLTICDKDAGRIWRISQQVYAEGGLVSAREISSAAAFDWNRFCTAGGIAAFIFLLYSLATIVQMAVLGGPASDVAEAFQLLQQNKLLGLLRLDLATVLVLPFYYLLFFGLFAALKDTNRTGAAAATGLVFIGLTLVLATPTALPLAELSEKYAAATTEAARERYLAAGEAILLTDVWHSTSAYIGGLLLQVGAVWISAVMLRGVFSKLTAWIGIITHALDGAHILLMPFLPKLSVPLMIVAGIAYPVWLYMIGRRLLHLGNVQKT